MAEIITVDTQKAEQAIEIGPRVVEVVSRSGVDSGLCQVMVLHSTAAVVVNETADPNIGADIVSALQATVPTRNDWLHDRKDDNAHAHLKASLLGPSEMCSSSASLAGMRNACQVYNIIRRPVSASSVWEHP